MENWDVTPIGIPRNTKKISIILQLRSEANISITASFTQITPSLLFWKFNLSPENKYIVKLEEKNVSYVEPNHISNTPITFLI